MSNAARAAKARHRIDPLAEFLREEAAGGHRAHRHGAAALIAQLAYEDTGTVSTAKVGIFAGSLLSATVGAAMLLMVSGRANRSPGRHSD